MNSLPRQFKINKRIALGLPAAVVGLLLSACAPPPPPSRFPPSASDLSLLKSTRLCDRKADFLQRRESGSPRREAWEAVKKCESRRTEASPEPRNRSFSTRMGCWSERCFRSRQVKA